MAAGQCPWCGQWTCDCDETDDDSGPVVDIDAVDIELDEYDYEGGDIDGNL